jgi:hypothetical protein
LRAIETKKSRAFYPIAQDKTDLLPSAIHMQLTNSNHTNSQVDRSKIMTGSSQSQSTSEESTDRQTKHGSTRPKCELGSKHQWKTKLNQRDGSLPKNGPAKTTSAEVLDCRACNRSSGRRRASNSRMRAPSDRQRKITHGENETGGRALARRWREPKHTESLSRQRALG